MIAPTAAQIRCRFESKPVSGTWTDPWHSASRASSICYRGIDQPLRSGKHVVEQPQSCVAYCRGPSSIAGHCDQQAIPGRGSRDVQSSRDALHPIRRRRRNISPRERGPRQQPRRLASMGRAEHCDNRKHFLEGCMGGGARRRVGESWSVSRRSPLRGAGRIASPAPGMTLGCRMRCGGFHVAHSRCRCKAGHR